MQDTKLDGQPVAVRFDVSINTARVRCEVLARLLRRNVKCLLRGHSYAQNSLLAIMPDEIGTQNFRNFTCCESAHYIHLPETVLRGYIPLSKEQVPGVCRIDGRYSVSIPDHRCFAGETCNLHAAIKLWQGRARRRIEPRQSSQSSDHDRNQKQCQQAPETATSRSRNRNRGRCHEKISSILWRGAARDKLR